MSMTIIALIAGGLFASAVTWFVGRKQGVSAERDARNAARETAEQMSKRILGEAERDAEALKKQAVLAGKEDVMKAREEWEAEARHRRGEIEIEEKRLMDREVQPDKKVELLETRERDLGRRASDLGRKEKGVEEKQAELDKMVGDERRRLEQMAGMSAQEAKAELIRRMEEEAHADAANKIREIRETAKRNADREAKKIVALAVQRIAAEHTSEITQTAVSLPKDEIKGRIIGREGRNIRAFELATGVDVIIDDTPDTVVISCFDPVRRETARLALARLIEDGRIHPGRIEEVVEKARKEVEAGIIETGERAAYDVGIHGLHP